MNSSGKCKESLAGRASVVEVMAQSELEAILLCNSAHNSKARVSTRVGELANFDLDMEKALKLFWAHCITPPINVNGIPTHILAEYLQDNISSFNKNYGPNMEMKSCATCGVMGDGVQKDLPLHHLEIIVCLSYKEL